MTYVPVVKIVQEGFCWLVHLDGVVVGRFDVVGEALHYANMLECDPRAREEASPAA